MLSHTTPDFLCKAHLHPWEKNNQSHHNGLRRNLLVHQTNVLRRKSKQQGRVLASLITTNEWKSMVIGQTKPEHQRKGRLQRVEWLLHSIINWELCYLLLIWTTGPIFHHSTTCYYPRPFSKFLNCKFFSAREK